MENLQVVDNTVTPKEKDTKDHPTITLSKRSRELNAPGSVANATELEKCFNVARLRAVANIESQVQLLT